MLLDVLYSKGFPAITKMIADRTLVFFLTLLYL